MMTTRRFLNEAWRIAAASQGMNSTHDQSREFNQKIASVRRGVEWLRWLRVLARAFWIQTLLFFCLGWFDQRFRPESAWIRNGMTVVFWGSAISLFFVLSRFVFKSRITENHAALAMGKTSDRSEEAASLNEFLTDEGQASVDDAWKRQFSLRASQASHELDQLQIRKIAGLAPLLSWLFLISTIFVLNYERTCLAWFRIQNPNSSVSWPRSTELVVMDRLGAVISPGSVVTVPTSQVAQFQVYNRLGRLPDDLHLEVIHGSRRIQKIPLEVVRSEKAISARQPIEFSVSPSWTGQTQFRLQGGDDDSSAWMSLKYRETPRLVSSHCVVIPPDYIQKESRTIDQWTGPIEVPDGGQAKIRFEFDQPVATAQLLDNQNGVIVDCQSTFPAAQAEYLLDFGHHSSETSEYVLGVAPIQERSEVALGSQTQQLRRVEFRVVADSAPVVSLARPESNRTVTPQAALPVIASAVDDHGLADFHLTIAVDPPREILGVFTSGDRVGELSTICEISQLSISEGNSFTIQAFAQDDRPETSLTQSNEVRVTVVTVDEKQEELFRSLRQVVATVEASRHLQIRVMETMQSLRDGTKPGIELASEWVTQSREIISRQSLIHEKLDEIIELDVNSLSEEIEINRLEDSTIAALTRQSHDQLWRLKQKHIVPLQSLLGEFRLELDVFGERAKNIFPGTTVNDQLGKIQEHQRGLEAGLLALIDSLAEWVDSSDLRTRWRLITQQLAQLLDETRQVAQKTVSRPWEQLGEKERAALVDIADANTDLSESVTALFADLDQQGFGRSPREIPLFTSREQGKISSQFEQVSNLLRENNVLIALEVLDRIHESFTRPPDTENHGHEIAEQEAMNALLGLREKFSRLVMDQRNLLIRIEMDAVSETTFREQHAQLFSELVTIEAEVRMIDSVALQQPFIETLRLVNSIVDHSSVFTNSEQLSMQVDLVERLTTVEFELEKIIQSELVDAKNSALRQIARDSSKIVTMQRKIIESTLPIVQRGSGHFSRSDRRILTSMSKEQARVVDFISELMVVSRNVPPILQLLESIHQSAESSERKLNQKNLSEDLIAKMEWIELVALSLSTPQLSNQDIDASQSVADTGKPMILRIALQLQTALHQKSVDLLSEPQSTRKQKGQKLASRQAEVTKFIESLLQESPSDWHDPQPTILQP